jgi:sugar phosphate isomerase/epimerase
MLVGAMNHPQEDVIEEIASIAELGLEFVDLTIEPPAAASWKIDAQAIRASLQKHQLHVIGHTSFYLPLASPFEEVRAGAVVELKRCLELFAEVGAKWMNIHPDRPAPMHDYAFCISQNLRSLRELLPISRSAGVGLMLENIPGQFNSVEQLSPLLDAIPELGMHLDIGHCNLLVQKNTAEDLIARYGDRLRHVHLHDNKGGSADLHLPLGTGSVDVPGAIRALKAIGYDDTITLEVFSNDRRYLSYSCEVLRRIWREN